MEEKPVYMEVREERGPRRTENKKPLKILAIAVALLLVLAVIGVILFRPGNNGARKDDEKYNFSINTSWSSRFHRYIVTLEDPAVIEDLHITISNGDVEEDVRGSGIKRINDHQFLVTSELELERDVALTVSVYVNGKLFGSRSLVPLMLEWDETASGNRYNEDFYHASVKDTFDGYERLVQSIAGTVDHTGGRGGMYVNFTGAGETLIEQRLNNPDLTYDVDMNIDTSTFTMSVLFTEDDKKVVRMVQEGTGSGTFEIEAKGIDFEMSGELTVEEYLITAENDNLTGTTVRSNGEFEGTYEGEIDMETWTAGQEKHDNYLGVEYPCVVLENRMHIRAFEGPIPVIITSREKMWNVKSLDFEYGTIYYEANTTVTGQSASEDSGYIEDAPRPANITIHDVVRVRGFVPATILGNDTFSLSSVYGYEIEYRGIADESPGSGASGTGDPMLIEGEVIRNGEGSDRVLLLPDRDGGLHLIERHSVFYWEGELISTNSTLK